MEPTSPISKKRGEGFSSAASKKGQKETSSNNKKFNISPGKTSNSNHQLRHTKSGNKTDSFQSGQNISSLKELDDIKYDDPMQEIAALKEQKRFLKDQLNRTKQKLKKITTDLQTKQRQCMKEKEYKERFLVQLQQSHTERDTLQEQSSQYVLMYEMESENLTQIQRACRKQENEIAKMKRILSSLEEDLKKEKQGRTNIENELALERKNNKEAIKKSEENMKKLEEKKDKEIKEEKRNHEEKIKQVQAESKNKEKQILLLKEEFKKKEKAFSDQNNQKEKEISLLKKQKAKNLETIQELTKKEKTLNEQIKKNKDLKLVDENRIKELIQTIEQNRKQFKKSTQQNEKKILNLRQFLERQNKQLETETKKVGNLQKALQSISLTVFGEREEVDYGILSKQVEKIKYFPDSLMFTGKNTDKQGFISQQIRKFLKIKSFKSNLIYRYDPLNGTNVHKYIDGRQNILSFVKLTNGVIIGGFSVYPYSPEKMEKDSKGSGFLFSLSLSKCFKQRGDARQGVTTYDNFYYIFGNAEIRIRTQERKVFSNFGIATSTFDAEKVTRAEFLGVKDNANNEIEIETYEFYQLTSLE